MDLKIYNTLTRTIVPFEPVEPGRVTMYTCGPTVYNYAHIGNFRTFLFEDLLRRHLESLGNEVFQIMNLTDVDDRTIKAASESGKTLSEHTAEFIRAFHEDCEYLRIRPASVYPRATDNIEAMISLLEELLERGLAYRGEDGSVYYAVDRFESYGRLSQLEKRELKVGARVASDEYSKDDARDFALWKAAKPGEPYWLSPWGKGRPGWHIECSAMAMHYLGETFDIHMGGEDLIFPHHENEIAQSVAATGQPFVRYWLHNGWVTLSGEKMAKSTGHFFLIEDLLKEYDPNIIRMYLLKTHYRNQIEFSRERLDEARSAYFRILSFLSGFKEIPAINKPSMNDEFIEAMNDDLNAPKALGIIFDLVNKGYENSDPEIAASINTYMAILGFRKEQAEEPFAEIMNVLREVAQRLVQEDQAALVESVWKEYFRSLEIIKNIDDVFPALVHFLLDIRNQLRKNKKFEYADLIRDKLAEHGVMVHDTGTDSSTYKLEIK